jgi:hypothetical protein
MGNESILNRSLIGLFIGAVLYGGLLYSPIGWNIRVKLAEIVLVTRYQPYAWIFVGTSMRDQMLQEQIVQHCGHFPDKNHPCL